MTGIHDEPMCPCCCMYIATEYMQAHLQVDHSKRELSAVLSQVALQDWEDWKEELKQATIVTPQE